MNYIFISLTILWLFIGYYFGNKKYRRNKLKGLFKFGTYQSARENYDIIIEVNIIEETNTKYLVNFSKSNIKTNDKIVKYHEYFYDAKKSIYKSLNNNWIDKNKVNIIKKRGE